MSVGYFEKLHSNKAINYGANPIPNMFSGIEDSHLCILNKYTVDWEIKNALFNIDLWKASSIDGFPTAFLFLFFINIGI